MSKSKSAKSKVRNKNSRGKRTPGDIIRQRTSASIEHLSTRPASESKKGPLSKRPKSSDRDEVKAEDGRISEATEGPKELYVMVNPSDVPARLAHSLELFHLFDGAQYVVGFCLPHHVHCEHTGEPSKARIVRVEKASDNFVNDYKHQYKFRFVPLKTVPAYEAVFNAMVASPYAPIKSEPKLETNFFVCSDESTTTPDGERLSADDTSKSLADSKFEMELNPHLTPFRYPDGLRTYMRLDLAEHCQYPAQPAEGVPFMCNTLKLPAEALPPPPPHNIYPLGPPLVRRVESRAARPPTSQQSSKHHSKTRNSPDQKPVGEPRDQGRRAQKTQDLRNQPWRKI